MIRADNLNQRPIGDYQGGGNDLLSSLGDRVSQAIKKDDSPTISFDPQAVKGLISQISPTPIAGSVLNTVV